MIRHFDLRQTLGIDDLVLRNDAVFSEQKGRYGIHLVGFQRAFFSERHTAIDVIPDGRRVWRMNRHDVIPPDAR